MNVLRPSPSWRQGHLSRRKTAVQTPQTHPRLMGIYARSAPRRTTHARRVRRRRIFLGSFPDGKRYGSELLRRSALWWIGAHDIRLGAPAAGTQKAPAPDRGRSTARGLSVCAVTIGGCDGTLQTYVPRLCKSKRLVDDAGVQRCPRGCGPRQQLSGVGHIPSLGRMRVVHALPPGCRIISILLSDYSPMIYG